MNYAVKISPPGPLSEGEGVCLSPPLRGGAGGGVFAGSRRTAAKFNCVTPNIIKIDFSTPEC
jgi:hypothetical protein